MISLRLIAVFAALAAVSAIPPTDRPAIPVPSTTITADERHDDSQWLNIPLFGNLFAPMWNTFPNFADVGPRIIVEDDKFQVVVNVINFKPNELKVKVKGDSIVMQGSHEGKQDDYNLFANQFSYTYPLPANSSSSDVTAELTSDKYLSFTVPLDRPVDRSKNTDREVTIVETGEPYLKEDKAGITTTLKTMPVEEVKKESTNPAERQEVTEKDNVIITHGNEVKP